MACLLFEWPAAYGITGGGVSSFRVFCLIGTALVSVSGPARPGEPLPMATVDFPPFAYTAPDGRSMGASTQIVMEAVSRMGYEPVVDTLPTKRAQQMTIEGAYSALFPVTKSRARAEYCVFSEPVSYFADVFFKRKSDKIVWEQLDDLGDYVIGATEGYNYAPVFLHAIRDGRLKIDFVVSGSPELQHLRKLVKGRIDLAICERSVCAHLLKKHEPELDSLDFIFKSIGPLRGFHVCFSRKWPGVESIAASFNQEMRKLRQEGRIDATLERYGVIESNE
jgi:polar amino acid transport system substrate-binding protein